MRWLRHIEHRESRPSQVASEYVPEDVPEDASESQRRSGSAHQHATAECAMRRNTIARPRYHWNSLMIRNCYRRRILHKHNQHSPCSVLDTARYHTLHPNGYTINILSALSYPPCEINIRPEQWTGDSIGRAIITPDTFENLKPNSGFQQSIPNIKTKFRIPNTKCQNLQELMYRLQYPKHSVA